MSFLVYDLSFLVLFTIFIFVFLYVKRKNITREGILYLYKTQIGVKFIDYIGKKFPKTIRGLHYPIIIIGYALLAGILFILGQAIYIYLKVPEITQIIKAPPLVPLIPYFPSLFGASNLFPPFYFIYFIVALIIVAVSHEFAHGILARANKVRIKSTGFVFLGPILGAFVEQDDDQMKRKKKIPQMAILGAGVFANIVIALIFFILLILVFNTMFIPSGITFSTYSFGILDKGNIISITELPEGLSLIATEEQNFILDNENIETQLDNEANEMMAYYNAPAIKNNLQGSITEINSVKVTNLDIFTEEMMKYEPGDLVEIKTTEGTYDLELGEHPLDKNKGFLGIAFSGVPQNRGIRGLFSSLFFFKDPTVHYEEKFSFSNFTYNLIWWIALINLMVGLFNMLPFGFLDGGRFFYLTILGLTKSKKFAKKAFKFASMLIVFIFLLLMFVWFIAFL